MRNLSSQSVEGHIQFLQRVKILYALSEVTKKVVRLSNISLIQHEVLKGSRNAWLQDSTISATL